MSTESRKPFRPAALAIGLLFFVSTGVLNSYAEDDRILSALDQLGGEFNATGAVYEPAAISAKTVVEAPDAEQSKSVAEIVIYHTNDVHGSIDAMPDRPDYGGAASLATMLKREKKPHIWIDSGDWFQGIPEGSLTRGAAVFDIFNRLGLTATVIGNHDFDYGEAVLKDLAKTAGFPVLAANIFSQDTGAIVSYARPYVIVEPYSGIKIGIFGVITKDMKTLSLPDNIKGLKFGSEKTAARKAVDGLKSEGADIIIGATHLGIEEYQDTNYGINFGDFMLAKEVPGIDVILGGHTHTDVWPDSVCTMNKCGTIVAQTRGKLRKVNRIVLYVDTATRRLVGYKSRELSLDHFDYPPDPGIAAVVEGYKNAVGKEMNKVIGSASMELAKGGDGESLMGNWMTDVLRNHAKTDLGIINTHGIPSGLPAGEIKYGDVYRVSPFENHVAIVKIAGSELKKLAENSLVENSILLQFSGAEITYDQLAPNGRKLVGMKVGGAPVQDDRNYTFATADFMAISHKTMEGIKRDIIEITPLLMRDLLAREITANSPISSSIKGWLKTASGSGPAAAK